MRRVLVIGIGSRMMRDDSIGVRVVEALRSSFCEHEIASLVGETDVQYCLDEMRPEDVLIIIDAMVLGKAPGHMEVMCLQDALQERGKLRCQHDCSLLDLIVLHAPKTHGYFIGIEAAEIDFGLELSASLREEYDSICNAVLREVLTIKEETEHA